MVRWDTIRYVFTLMIIFAAGGLFLYFLTANQPTPPFVYFPAVP